MYGNVKAELVKNELTVKDLAGFLGISVSAVSSKLKGETKLTFGEAVKIKSFLNADLPLEELFKFSAAKRFITV